MLCRGMAKITDDFSFAYVLLLCKSTSKSPQFKPALSKTDYLVPGDRNLEEKKTQDFTMSLSLTFYHFYKFECLLICTI